MVARYIFYFLLLIVLPDLYIWLRYIRCSCKRHRWQQWAWWLPTAVIAVYTLWLSLLPGFVPDHMLPVSIWLFLLCVVVLPKVAFSLTTLVGWSVNALFRRRWVWSEWLGTLLALTVAAAYLYGTFVGFGELRVREVTIAHPQLPQAFDGYRIAHFSDAHVGTYSGWRRKILRRAVETLNAQQADAIVFTGDLQNARPEEIAAQRDLLSLLRAKDGVYSVMGNHDYAKYVWATDAQKVRNIRRTQQLERDLGWQLLLNEHRIIRHEGDSMVIAGMENDGEPPFPQLGNIRKTLSGIADSTFVVMLQHDPSAWRRTILPQSSVQLTLCGHTHGGQMSFFGWRPTQVRYKEDRGLYREGNRCLYVSSGLGGLIAFRLFMPGEIVVYTLKTTKE